MDIRRKEKKAKSKVEKKEQRWKAAVVTLSDKGYAGEREDKSGPLLCGMLEEAGYEVTEVRLLPDEQKHRVTAHRKRHLPWRQRMHRESQRR